jgi:predicted nucleic acid binding AN1-type Zn finger protein
MLRVRAPASGNICRSQTSSARKHTIEVKVPFPRWRLLDVVTDSSDEFPGSMARLPYLTMRRRTLDVCRKHGISSAMFYKSKAKV